MRSCPYVAHPGYKYVPHVVDNLGNVHSWILAPIKRDAVTRCNFNDRLRPRSR